MNEPLIVGAGPTGLAAALFLAHKGVRARIVDKAPEATTTSKALAVNPRTLELLKPTGVSDRIMAEGRVIRRMVLRRDGEVVVEMGMAELPSAFPMVALPQARTEALLTEALAGFDISPERGLGLDALEQDEGRATARLTYVDGRAETVETPVVFGADGAHSVARHQLSLDFPGSSLPEPWRLADVEFQTPVDAPEGYIDLYARGLVFALMFTPTHWRFISTIGDPLDTLPPGSTVKDVPWRSDFHISHRVAERMSVGRVCLGGDAAHLHSPIGARGMNLGIEDAYVFAELAAEALQDGGAARLEDYGRLRHRVDAGVVRRIELMTRMMQGDGAWSLARRIAPPLASRSSKLREIITRTAAGLDHPLRLS